MHHSIAHGAGAFGSNQGSQANGSLHSITNSARAAGSTQGNGVSSMHHSIANGGIAVGSTQGNGVSSTYHSIDNGAGAFCATLGNGSIADHRKVADEIADITYGLKCGDYLSAMTRVSRDFGCVFIMQTVSLRSMGNCQ
jgi:hypothetical protein